MGDYTVKITASVKFAQTYKGDVIETVSKELSFQIEVFEACKTTTLSALELSDTTVTVLGQSISQTIEPPKDIASFKYGDKDGTTFCGDRIYQITNQESQASFVQIADDTIKVHALEEAQIGEHEISIKASLKDYPS